MNLRFLYLINLLTFSVILYSQELKGKILSSGYKSDKFVFLSNEKLIQINTLNKKGIPIEKKLKYYFKNNVLRITLYWKLDGYIDAETYYLFYEKSNNCFIDKESDLTWFFVDEVKGKKVYKSTPNQVKNNEINNEY